ncbi:MAG: DNA repair protein RecO [Gemmatimonadota bacterium]
MPLVDTPALILHAFPYGDTSRILRLLTPELGVRSVIAKGAQRPKSRFGGILEPFTEGTAHFNLREGRDLFTLSGFSLLRSRQGVGRNLAAFTGASLIAEITLRSGTEEPNPELYATVVFALDRLAEPLDDPALTALAAIWNIVSILGFRPQTDACVRCSRLFEPGEPSRFDVESGGAACRTCRPAGRLVDAAARDQLGRMSRGEVPDPEAAARSLHAALLDAFLSTHLAPDRPLRSIELFLEQLQ